MYFSQLPRDLVLPWFKDLAPNDELLLQFLPTIQFLLVCQLKKHSYLSFEDWKRDAVELSELLETNKLVRQPFLQESLRQVTVFSLSDWLISLVTSVFPFLQFGLKKNTRGDYVY